MIQLVPPEFKDLRSKFSTSSSQGDFLMRCLSDRQTLKEEEV